MEKQFFLSVLCLIRNEQKLLREFVPYYFSQGVDHIYFLDDRSTAPYDDFITQDPKIEFIKLETAKMTKVPTLGQIKACIQKVYLQIRNQTKWLMVIDADEFITTRLNKSRTIRDELETTFQNADCIKIPWVMFGSSGNQKTPESILKSCVYRWNYDKKHPHPFKSVKHQCRYHKIEVKCIIKPEKFLCVSASPHHPTNPVKPNGYVSVNSVNGAVSKIDPFYANLRNKDISRAILTCNHYRYYSREFMQQKCNSSHIDQRYTTKHALRDMLAADYNEILDTSISSKIELDLKGATSLGLDLKGATNVNRIIPIRSPRPKPKPTTARPTRKTNYRVTRSLNRRVVQKPNRVRRK
jgi:hypothetical protein